MEEVLQKTSEYESYPFFEESLSRSRVLRLTMLPTNPQELNDRIIIYTKSKIKENGVCRVCEVKSNRLLVKSTHSIKFEKLHECREIGSVVGHSVPSVPINKSSIVTS